MPLNDSLTQLPHRRRGQRGRAAVRHWRDDASHDAGSDAACPACRRSCAKAIGIPRRSRCATRRDRRDARDDAQRAAAETRAFAGFAARRRSPPGQARDIVVARDSARSTHAQLHVGVSAREADGGGGDKLKRLAAVIPPVPVRTYQATIAAADGDRSSRCRLSGRAGAVPGRGGLEVTLRAKLGDGLDGVREYMSWYRFTCFEQQLSRAVALRDEGLWRCGRRGLPAYLDRDGLLKYFPTDRLEGDDALTAYVLVHRPRSGLGAPGELRAAPHDRRAHALRRGQAHAPLGAADGGSGDSQAAAIAALVALRRGPAADARQHPRSSRSCGRRRRCSTGSTSLKRVPRVARAEQRRAAALQILRTRLNFQGTTMGFSTERSDALWWLMISADVQRQSAC